MVGGSDLSLRPTPGRHLDANRSSLVRNTRFFTNWEGARRNSGVGNVGLVVHQLAQAQRPRCRMLAFIP